MHHPAGARAVRDLLAVAFMYSLAGTLIKSMSWDPLQICAARNGLGFVILLAFARQLPRRVGLAEIVGAAGITLCTGGFMWATKFGTAANAVVLLNTAPFFAMLIAWVEGLYRKVEGSKVPRGAFPASLVVAVGLILMFREDMAADSLVTNSVALLSGVGFAVWTYARSRQDSDEPYGLIMLGLLASTVCFLPFLFSPEADLSHETLNARDVSLVLIQGVLLACSYVLLSKCLRYVSAAVATIMTTLAVVLNPLWVALFNGEIPSAEAAFGGLLVAGACCYLGVRTASMKR